MTLNFGPLETLPSETPAPPRCRLRLQIDPRKIPLGSHPRFPYFLQKIADLIHSTYPLCQEPFFQMLDHVNSF